MFRRVPTGILVVLLAAGLCLSYALVKADVKTEEPPKAMKADEPKFEDGYSLVGGKAGGGLFVQRKSNQPYACLVSLPGPIAVLGFGRSDEDVAAKGFPFAVVTTKDEVYFQVRDKKGDLHFIPVEALTKLAPKVE